MAIDAALVAFLALAPSRARSRLPAFSSLVEHVMLFAAMTDSVHFGCEPNMVASLRVQHAGACNFIAMFAVDVLRYYK